MLEASSCRRIWPGLAILYIASVIGSSAWSVGRYRRFESGWAWDLAHVNQSFWAITHGVPQISVRPVNHYAREGPEPWRSVHLALSRVFLLPAYTVCPRPETLLVGHCAIFWLSIFSVARLARAAGDSTGPGDSLWQLLAAMLWVATPASLLFAINDCRPLQLGVPFFLWAIAEYVDRRPVRFAIAALAALCSRQEYGVAVALLAILSPGADEPPARTWRWRAATLVAGVAWFAGYLFYLHEMFGPAAPARYFEVPSQFARTDLADLAGGFVHTVRSVVVLAGGWAVLAIGAPRFLVASLPFVYLLVQRNLSHLLPADSNWHLVRYAAMPIAFWVAGGVITARRAARSDWFARWRTQRPRRLAWKAGLAVLLGWLVPTAFVQFRLARVPAAIAANDVRPLGKLIATIPADARVWSSQACSAMLSGRARLFGLMEPGTDTAPSPLHDDWIVGVESQKSAQSALARAFESAGFEEVFHGTSVNVLRRRAADASQSP